MSRRIGAYVLFDQQAFEPEVSAMIDRVEDLKPIMRTISYMAAEDGRKQSVGNPDWPDLDPDTIEKKRREGLPLTAGVGAHGGFAPTITPFYGRRNAGWKTKAPHAHLFEGGTKRYSVGGSQVNVWSGGKGEIKQGKNKGKIKTKHKSKAASLALLIQAKSEQHQPARPFGYFADGAHERYNDMIAAFVLLNQE